MSAKASQDSPKSQTAKFEQLARELECDEDEAKFSAQVKKIATAAKPEPRPKWER